MFNADLDQIYSTSATEEGKIKLGSSMVESTYDGTPTAAENKFYQLKDQKPKKQP